MDIPQSQSLSTFRLGKVFTNTVATYKYFWFLSILQIHAKTEELRVNVWDIVIRMIANAWYPIHYFRLSFGKSDSLFNIVIELQKITGISIDADIETICASLHDRVEDIQIKSRLKILTFNVPYRFLRPWINTSDDKEMVIRSQTLENGWSRDLLLNMLGTSLYERSGKAQTNFKSTLIDADSDLAQEMTRDP